MPPPALPLVAEGLPVLLVQLLEGLEPAGALGDDGALAEVGEGRGEVVLLGVGFDVAEEVGLWDADEGVLDSGGLVSVDIVFLPSLWTHSPVSFCVMLMMLCFRASSTEVSGLSTVQREVNVACDGPTERT